MKCQYLFLLCFLLPALSFADLKTIKEVCQKFYEPPVCVQILMDDPRTHSADLPTLADITLNLAITNVTSTKAKLEAQLKDATKQKHSVETCIVLYNFVLNSLDKAAEFFAKKNYSNAYEMISAVVFGPSTCQDTLGKVLFKENGDAFNLLLIARAFETANMS